MQPRLERAVPISQEYVHTGAAIGGDDIGLAVAVQIAYCQGGAGVPGLDRRRLEGSVPVPEQSIKGGAVERNIGLSVAIEIANAECVGAKAVYQDGRLERAVAVSERDTVGAVGITDEQI